MRLLCCCLRCVCVLYYYSSFRLSHVIIRCEWMISFDKGNDTCCNWKAHSLRRPFLAIKKEETIHSIIAAFNGITNVPVFHPWHRYYLHNAEKKCFQVQVSFSLLTFFWYFVTTTKLEVLFFNLVTFSPNHITWPKENTTDSLHKPMKL